MAAPHNIDGRRNYHLKRVRSRADAVRTASGALDLTWEHDSLSSTRKRYLSVQGPAVERTESTTAARLNTSHLMRPQPGTSADSCCVPDAGRGRWSRLNVVPNSAFASENSGSAATASTGRYTCAPVLCTTAGSYLKPDIKRRLRRWPRPTHASSRTPRDGNVRLGHACALVRAAEPKAAASAPPEP